MHYSPRSEKEVLKELEVLCKRPGYIHVLAAISFRDNFISFSKELSPKALADSYREERTIRTEFTTLQGLMLKGSIDAEIPSTSDFNQMLQSTGQLLQELHGCLNQPMMKKLETQFKRQASGLPPAPDSGFLDAGVLREAVFYGGESAYSFQYRDFAVQRYSKDSNWLTDNCGFTISEAINVTKTLQELQDRQLNEVIKSARKSALEQFSILPGFLIDIPEIAKLTNLPLSVVAAVINCFAVSAFPSNQDFENLGDFNLASAKPILKLDDGRYILMQSYALSEAIYESPFFWMGADSSYKSIAFDHRGQFTEDFVAEKMVRVFGDPNVYRNVDIYVGKERVGEIDVLVTFADRAIVMQCKSKRMTIAARKGNDQQIRDDFEKAVQNSYDQSVLCAKHLNDPNAKFKVGKHAVDLGPNTFRHIYPITVVSDHYPALAVQAREFLQTQSTESLKPPYVTDVFLLDVVAEFLDSPLRFLSFVDRRVNYGSRINAINEMTVLGYHLNQNLWVDEGFDLMTISDDVAIDLDTAMAVRREGVPGEKTPKGILTTFQKTVFGKIIKSIENSDHSALIDLGFMLLKMGSEGIKTFNKGIFEITKQTKQNKNHHDFTMGFDGGMVGLTVHTSYSDNDEAASRLKQHCERRKYRHKADSWFGLFVRPGDGLPKYGLNLQFPWEFDAGLESMTNTMPLTSNISTANEQFRTKKAGRNDKCPCGSGLKFKRCCLINE